MKLVGKSCPLNHVRLHKKLYSGTSGETQRIKPMAIMFIVHACVL